MKRPFLWIPLGFFSLAAIAFGALSTIPSNHPTFASTPADGGSLAPLVERVRPSVVGVVSVMPEGADVPPEIREFWKKFFNEEPPSRERMGVGSGVVIDPKGIILTNNHVVAGAKSLRVRTADEKEYEAVLVGADPTTDIAMLRLEDLKEPLQAATLGDSDAILVGDFVMAIGSPFGLALTVTSGIVSAKARVIGAGPYDDFLQTDAAINPGNSGGPLFDMEGRVVGINTAIVAAGQGIGFAVPINLIRAELGQLEEKGRVVRGFMGIAIQDLTPELAEALGLDVEKGALVASVSDDGPAKDSGIQPGDVIVSVDGEAVQGARELSRRVSLLSPGTEVRLGVQRDGEERTVPITLGERPNDGEEPPPPPPPEDERPSLGVRVGSVPPQLQKRFGIEGGAMVGEVEPGSRADEAGLEPGDVIAEVNRKPVGSPEELIEVVENSKGQRLLLRVFRGEGAAFLVVPPAG